jgi:hypothetical protein
MPMRAKRLAWVVPRSSHPRRTTAPHAATAGRPPVGLRTPTLARPRWRRRRTSPSPALTPPPAARSALPPPTLPELSRPFPPRFLGRDASGAQGIRLNTAATRGLVLHWLKPTRRAKLVVFVVRHGQRCTPSFLLGWARQSMPEPGAAVCRERQKNWSHPPWVDGWAMVAMGDGRQ